MGRPTIRPCLRFEGQAWTHDQFAAWVAAEAAGLAARGVAAGDRVAVLALNHPRTLALLFACARLGAILAPLNWRLAGPELQWIIDDAAPKLLFVDGIAPHVERQGTTTVPLPSREGLGVGEDRKNLGSGIFCPSAPTPGPSLAGKGEASGSPTLPSTLQDLLLVYTSGTTGRPKGAVLTAAALLANAALSRHMHALRQSDHVLTVLPLFHVGGLNIQTIPALLAGATVTLHPRFDPAATLAAIQHDRPTLTVLVPATLQALADHPAWRSADLSSLRAVTTGSTVVQPAVTAPLVARGVPVLQVYGSTETAPIAIYTPFGRPYPPTSTGHPGPGIEARTDAPPGQPGEILLRGPQLFRGYWNNPAATAEALRDDWYRTGDIGTAAPDGSWTVHDRCKHLIVSGGENIYPAEIERVLHELPQVAEAAVVGRPDPRWQEVPEAHVVLRPGAMLDEAAVIAHVHAELARFKAPRRVHFVPSLPRNAMGKVRYDALAP